MLHGIMVDSFLIHVETVCPLINHIQIVGSGKKATQLHQPSYLSCEQPVWFQDYCVTCYIRQTYYIFPLIPCQT